MESGAVDYSHKPTDAAHAVAPAIAKGSVEASIGVGSAANAAENTSGSNLIDPGMAAECESCSADLNGGLLELLREIHPDYRPLCSVARGIGKGADLFHAGEKLDAVYVVQSGVFKRYFINEVGAETVTDFARRGQLLGIEALLHGSASMSAMALADDGSVCALPLTALASVPDTFWSAWLMNIICEERKRERALRDIQRCETKAETRIAFFLLEHATSCGRRQLCEHSLRLAIPRQDIASYLNLDVDTVASAFERLQQAGIIHIERTALTIIKPDFLFMLASPDKQSEMSVCPAV